MHHFDIRNQLKLHLHINIWIQFELWRLEISLQDLLDSAIKSYEFYHITHKNQRR